MSRRPFPAGAVPRRRGRLRRRIHLLPHLFTIANLFAGFIAVSAVLNGNYDLAAVAIGFGVVLDGLDGAAARLVRTSSRIGVQLDSLADVVTFGVAPALLAFAWGSGGLEAGAENVAHVRRVGWIAAFAILAACTLRLARFNVMSHDEEAEAPVTPRAAFTGMPAPTAAATVAVVVHLVKEPLRAWEWGALWTGLLFLLAGFMVSRMPFPKPKHILAGRLPPHLLMLSVALLLAAVYYYSEIVLTALLALYLLAVAAHNLSRRRRSGREKPSPVRETG